MTMTTTFSTDCDTDWPDFIGSWPRLKGSQTPRFESRHPGDESEGDRCAKFGQRVGMRCMPWEWQTLRAILSRQPLNEWGERVWTHRDSAIECTRQQGKTLIIVLRILYGLFVLKEMRIIYTAQRWSTAYDVFKRVVAVIERIPSLKRRLSEKPSKAGNRGMIRLTNGASAEFGPRSQDFGRGYTEIDLLIIDEAYDVDPEEEANLTGAQSAARNPQTIYISTAPVADVHPKCHALAALHRLGHTGAPDLYYALYAAPADMSREDPDAWALAQPSYGVATNEREIRSKVQKAKTAAQRAIFDADYMGWGDYPPDEAEIASPIPDDVWECALDVGVKLVGPRAMALDRTRNRKTWALAAAQRTSDGRIFVEIGYAADTQNSQALAATVAAVASLNPVALVIDTKSAAAVLVPELTAAGIEATITNSAQLARASGAFLDDALSGQLAHPGQDLLTDGVRSAAMREIPGGFTWDEPHNGGTAMYLRAATLARWALMEFGNTVTVPSAAPVVAAPETAKPHSGNHELDVFTAF